MNDMRPWTEEEFEARLRAMGERYHIHHPYQVMMHRGLLSREQIQGWVANRYYYQINIPIKDAAILANCPEREVRRHWVQRILDHDGFNGEDGGIEAWIRLGMAVGLSRETIVSQVLVLPGVRFAVDAYVNFARQRPWQEAAAASLTELFAPTIHQSRLDFWPKHYPWIEPEGYDYFRRRLSEAPRDVINGLRITLGHFNTRELQERALTILQFKLDILWSMLDAMLLAYADVQIEGWGAYKPMGADAARS
ncbi:MAG TPA: pyrroloquinoline-quinone synthase PqqC [Noviherbaspirillum sp.]|uniref:pyrroloquinoline-quinone synthase PqqC n=1 Tax=Noviherbaspirillum sp. TaxID=1926288 RepID=UPI002B46C68E|nr:pyrroloquinoline-quinone synthase PqqC [Noviherbaspirillum sp.]HJV84194.1 pyrroloquinoline-quinone synthase PqqC [Noviherbaspirillum sp.]